MHHCIDAKAEVIDPDYRGNIIVILHNYGSTAYEIKIGDRIAQVVFYCIKTPSTDIVSSLSPMLHGDGGLGSTGRMHSLQIAHENQAVLNQVVPNPLPFDIWMSHDPFDAVIPVQIDLKGHHPTLGMVFETCPIHNRLPLKDIVPSTPAAKIKKWRSTLKNHHLVSVGTHIIRTIDELTSIIQTFMDNNNLFIQLCFSVDKHYGINPTSQIPILHWDQLNAISDINRSINQNSGHHNHDPITGLIRALQIPPDPPPIPLEEEHGREFKLSELINREDWPDWQQSRYKMLDNYKEQKMFGMPQQKPQGIKALRMLWIYLLKPDKTKKARMVCGGSPGQGAITL